MWRRPYHVFDMHAKWTLIHSGGITDSFSALWSYFQYKVWSTFKLFEKWTLIHFWFLMKCLKELLKAVDFKINFELDYFSNNNRTSTVIISLTNVWNAWLNLDLVSNVLGKSSSVTNIHLNSTFWMQRLPTYLHWQTDFFIIILFFGNKLFHRHHFTSIDRLLGRWCWKTVFTNIPIFH